jgi:putative aldouronate transport system substrate-binding protein
MKKFVALFLAIFLMASVVGCQPASQPEATSAPQVKEVSTEAPVDKANNTEPMPAAIATEPPLDIWAKYDPPIEVTSYKVSDANLKYPAGLDMNNNLWTQLYEEELGIKVNFLWSVPEEQMETKINISIASNDMPDISLVTQAQLKMLVENDMVYDLTDVYNTYASEVVNKIAENDKYMSLNGGTIDGKIYGLPQTLGNEGGVLLYIRTDWLENVGMEPPKTIDELVAIAEAFANNDPDQNGVKDTIGLALTSDFFAPAGGATGFFYGYHAFPTTMLNRDNGVVFGGVQPEVKAALGKLAEMYKNGTIDPEFATRDSSKVMEMVVSEKVGMFYGEDWVQFYWPFPSLRSKNPNADWRAFELPSVDGEPSKIAKGGPGVTTYYVVNKNFDHPEAVVKLANLSSKLLSQSSTEYTEDYHVKIYDDGEKYMTWQWQAVNNYGPGAFSGQQQIKEWWDNGKPDNYFDTYNPWVADMMDQMSKYMGLKEGSDNMWHWVTYIWMNPEDGAVPIVKKYFDEDRLEMAAYNGVATSTMVEKGATLEKLRDEVFTRIVMGQDSVDAFDKYAKDWLALGGEDILAEINEALK